MMKVQYKEYSKRDMELLTELDKQFDGLYGDALSEETEKDET